MKATSKRLFGLGAMLVLIGPIGLAGTPTLPSDADSSLHRHVRKRLVTIPSFGVFDNLEFSIDTDDGTTVTLYGQVVRPSIRKDAERRVARIEGVERVINRIEVLPLSRFDDSIRRRTYQAVFRTSSMYRYALGPNPSIHIIVNSGHVTLAGVVRNETDRRLALLWANGVSGVFSVTDNLRVEKSGY